VLQINLNRFGFTSDGMPLKIQSKCEFGPTLDLRQHAGPDDIYHLHGILVHAGTLNSGHYFCYLRPTQQDEWFKFNDEHVTRIPSDLVFKQGQGGMTSHFGMFDGVITEVRQPINTQAYQLIYFRESEREDILGP
jgi:ubiquitin carboxyl-terminal hydrolase 7